MPVSRPAPPRKRIAGFFRTDPPRRLGVAVSGGGDSLALLVLLHEWSRSGGPALAAATVDHGLRRESAAEAAFVARFCLERGIAHDILRWDGWDGRGNLPDRARRARYALLARWAHGRGIAQVAVGHTSCDQAETFLMRLARGSGIDGLSAMDPRRRIGGVAFVRPALECSRAELRAVLRERGLDWIEDPTNEDGAFERVRARRAMGELAALGLDAATLSSVARNLADARDALRWNAFAAARGLVSMQSGDLIMDRAGLRDLPSETARRLMREALKWVGGGFYPPRGRSLGLLLDAVREGRRSSLQGCVVAPEGARVRVFREAAAVRELRVPAAEVWDGRWRLSGAAPGGVGVAALGERGLRQCPDARESGLPRESLIASPAAWRGGDLVAAPLAGLANGWRAELVRGESRFFDGLLSG